MAARDDDYRPDPGTDLQAFALVGGKAGRNAFMGLWQARPATVAVFVMAMAIVCALLLAVPGQTVVVKYVNDLMIFLDGAHRVASGQAPNRDFHAALGPLVYYVPAAGLFLSGALAGAMPVGTALVLLAVAPALAHILA